MEPKPYIHCAIHKIHGAIHKVIIIFFLLCSVLHVLYMCELSCIYMYIYVHVQ